MSSGNFSNAERSAARGWWHGALVYEVYLRSFADSDEDGIGDLPGLTARLDYIAGLGVDAIWITPFYPSPMKDFGYDVSDYTAIDPAFGTMADFDRLLEEAHARGLKIVLDHVWSHTSDAHPWFRASADPAHPEHAKYRDWYVWSPGKTGTDAPPNNWQSVFAGSAWTWHPRREAFYLHNFLVSQPDLSWHVREVREAVTGIARFWLEKGVDGFRLDVCNFYTHDAALKDNPPKPAPPEKKREFGDYLNIHNINQPENLAYLGELRQAFAAFPGAMALGELAGIDGDLQLVDRYLAPQGHLDTIYSDFLICPQCPAAEMLERLLAGVARDLPGKQLCWVLGTHDFHRVATRWRAGDPALQKDLVIQSMAFLLSLPGLSSIYQGDELGLPDGAITFEQMQDPQGINFGDLARSRDGCRVPFPWTAEGPSLGFNAGRKTWLPAQEACRALAAGKQEKAADSVLAATRGLIGERQATLAWRHGSLAAVRRAGTILSFERTSPEGRVLFVFNFSDKPAEAPGTPGLEKARVLYARGYGAGDGKFRLAAYGFGIVAL